MKTHTYKGIDIYPASLNSSGIRWYARLSTGTVRADTLAGIKEMISDAMAGKLTGASKDLNY